MRKGRERERGKTSRKLSQVRFKPWTCVSRHKPSKYMCTCSTHCSGALLVLSKEIQVLYVSSGSFFLLWCLKSAIVPSMQNYSEGDEQVRMFCQLLFLRTTMDFKTQHTEQPSIGCTTIIPVFLCLFCLATSFPSTPFSVSVAVFLSHMSE